MTDYLVKRLTNPTVPYDPEVCAQGFWEDLCGEAKARIEDLTAQLEETYARGFSAGQQALKDTGKLVMVTDEPASDLANQIIDEFIAEAASNVVLPCPFCGHKPECRLDDYINGRMVEDPMFYITCENSDCGVWPQAEGKYDTEYQQIVDAWNSRSRR